MENTVISGVENVKGGPSLVGQVDTRGSSDLRGYVSGAGAVSMAFLIELLKLNQEVRNEMAALNQETIKTQSLTYTAAANAQVKLYDSQANELTLQMNSQIASAVTSGASVGIGLASGMGSRKTAADAALAEEHMTSFNKISTATDLNTGDAPTREFTNPHDNSQKYTDAEKAHIDTLREELVRGGFGTSKFSHGNLDEAHAFLDADSTKKYSAKDVISSATPAQREKIAENLVESRKQARAANNTKIQEWSQYSSSLQTVGQVVSGAYDSSSKSAQAEQKREQGEAQALSQETQAETSVWQSAQKSVNDQRESAQSNVGQVLQTIRELVAADVRG